MNKINWDEITEDVEAVVAYKIDEDSHYKFINGVLHVEFHRGRGFIKSLHKEFSVIKLNFGDRFHIRPTKPEWTACNNTLPMSKLSNEQAAELFNHWRKGGEVDLIMLNGDRFEAECPSFFQELIYRIKSPAKTERELFIDAADYFIDCGDDAATIAGKMFDAGFKAPKVGE